MKIKIIIPLLCTCSFSLCQTTEKIIQYIKKYSHLAVIEMYRYKIPASITMAQAIIESGAGTSELAIQANNHFGIKCHADWEGMNYIQNDDEITECFRKYFSVEESYRDHSLFIISRPRYADLFNLPLSDYKKWAYGLKECGYATQKEYPEKLIKIIEQYQLYKLDHLWIYDTEEEALSQLPNELHSMLSPKKG
jgi:flagellum-specific peptidoglycan hydrolase FlgJ